MSKMDRAVDVSGRRERYNLAVAQFHLPTGSDLLARTQRYHDWTQSIREEGNWVYLSSIESQVSPVAAVRNDAGVARSGITFACQDYLSLSSHPAIHEAAVQAIREYGVHSAGSGAYYGNTLHSQRLERELGEFLSTEHVTLFPTGWMAGFGVVQGLVRPDDHIVIDQFAHACLQQGARLATRNIIRAEHLSVSSVTESLRRIRANDTRNGILVVTESLFSMHSDTPDLAALQASCTEHGATLLVDVAHDLGAMGASGRGALELQGVLGRVDLVMGAFSKTFASNGGFVASASPHVRQWLKGQANSHLFSNAMSPVQCAVVRRALELVASTEGARRRECNAMVASALRSRLAAHAIECSGITSPIVPVAVGELAVVRLAARLLFDRGIFVNTPEFPAVPIGEARFRMQVMADHSIEDARTAADAVAECVAEARECFP